MRPDFRSLFTAWFYRNNSVMFRHSVRAPRCIDEFAKYPESLCSVSALSGQYSITVWHALRRHPADLPVFCIKVIR